MTSSEPRLPISTYRLQFHGGFRFADATSLLPYLSELGVTECYCSPYLKANAGSRHGYDICEHGTLNPELGTDGDYDAFCAGQRSLNLGHIIDFVPNHMAADSGSNPWWRDVLENGPSSPFARYFDIDWDPAKPELRNKVLLPVLGDQYGRVLERGELQLRLDEGALTVSYSDRNFPINPRQAPRVLGLDADRLGQAVGESADHREYLSILTALHNLPPYTERDPGRIVERQREKEVARERLRRLLSASAPIRAHVEACIRLANGTPGDPATFDVLHDLLEHQAYRLAYWRTAFDEINYRRFFDVNELVALRMEEPAVFAAAHRLLAELVARGAVTGIRVDHPDGLFDPVAYFEQLQQLTGRPMYVVAEKILSPGESLGSEWRIAGTTGYSFLNNVSGLFIDSRHLRRMRRIYARVSGRQEAFADVAYRGRRAIMLTSLASELSVLAHALDRISEQDRQSRDFTLDSCRRVLREVVACFPVYRTYISSRGVSPFDRNVVATAIDEARRRNPLIEDSIFDFLQDVLLAGDGDTRRQEPGGLGLTFAMKFQQFTAPVQAKGVEDTAFYRDYTLVSANEVGGDPARPAVTPSEFHALNRDRLERWPFELLATSTHDTKRGEDARMRIDALSELPELWSKGVGEWMRINGRNRTKLHGVWAPDRNDEYLFYQALIGAWPADPSPEPPTRAAPDIVERLAGYMLKAANEAKVHTSWIDVDQSYAQAVSRFVTATLSGRTARRFLASFLPLQQRVARIGMFNSLSQLVLKLTSPGVPDFYQGSELWDMSLVDPDNRRPVDFVTRQQMLAELRPVLERLEGGEPVGGDLSRLLAEWEDGRIKLLVTTCGLRFRRAHPALVLRGAYTALEAAGAGADHIVGFARHDASGVLLVIVPRLIASILAPGRQSPLGDAIWSDTHVMLPAPLRAPRYRHVISGEWCDAAGPDHSMLPVASALTVSPVAMLWAPALSSSSP